MTTIDAIMEALQASGKFTNIQEIRGGACAYSFSARNTLTGRQVFLKAYYFDPGFSSELLREPQNLATAMQSTPTCQNVVDLYDAELLDVAGSFYMVCQMEHVSGPNLYAIMNESVLGQQQAVHLVLSILYGVGHLHSKKLIHRDLKPANIMYNSGSPKITDLGSARILASGHSYVRASKHSALYVPPEGWDNPSHYYIQSDLYQIGVVLYELLNGPLNVDPSHYIIPAVRREISAKGLIYNKLEAVDQSLYADKGIDLLARRGDLLTFGRSPRPYYGGQMQKIVRKATNPDYTHRFQDAREFMIALSSIAIPDWYVDRNGNYIAVNWRGYDWTIPYHQGSGNSVILEKCKHYEDGVHRKTMRLSFATLAEVFAYVENRRVRTI